MAHLRVIAHGNAALFEIMSQRWRAVGNTAYDLTGLRFESQASHCRDEQQKRFLITCTCTDCSRYTELRKICRVSAVVGTVLSKSTAVPVLA